MLHFLRIQESYANQNDPSCKDIGTFWNNVVRKKTFLSSLNFKTTVHLQIFPHIHNFITSELLKGAFTKISSRKLLPN